MGVFFTITKQGELMAKRRVLVLGASGFVGKNVFDQLTKRRDLELTGTYHTNQYERISDYEKQNFQQADLTDKKDVAKVMKDIDIVIQAAAVTSGIKDTIERPYIQITDNARMNSLIFESAHENHIKQVIFLSSSIVYPTHANRALTESDTNPDFLSQKHFGAAWTKIYLEKLAEFYANLGRTKYTVVRPANIYGPHDRFDLDRSHVLPAIIVRVTTACAGKITLWGNGREKKDLIYVADLVNLIELCLNKQKTKFMTINAGSDELISIKDLAKKIITLVRPGLKINWDPKGPSASTHILLDNTKAKQELGWNRGTILDEGIKKTVAWFKLNKLNQET